MGAHELEGFDSYGVLFHAVNLLGLEAEFCQSAVCQLSKCLSVLCKVLHKYGLCHEILKMVLFVYDRNSEEKKENMVR